MDLWFTEHHTKYLRFSLQVRDILYNGSSEYQNVTVLRTEEFGVALVLDGFIQLTEADEFIYHEMMTHPALASNPDVKRVLIIGGGDGGAARELSRYETIQSIDLVDIDSLVIDVSNKYLPFTSCGLNDPRVNIHIEDGLKYIRDKHDCYDLIIVDSTDPFSVGEGLFTPEFYGNCYKALNRYGVLINQHESVYYSSYREEVRRMNRHMHALFPICAPYQAHIATYPSGHWLFGYAAKTSDPLEFDAKRWNSLNIQTRYYNTQLHKGAFALPNYVLKIMSSDD